MKTDRPGKSGPKDRISGKIILLNIIFLIAAIFSSLTAPVCIADSSYESGLSASLLIGPDNTYTRSVLSAAPYLSDGTGNYHPNMNRFAGTANGNVVACLDIQAVPALENGIASHFTPHCRTSVIFAADPGRVDSVPESWAEIAESSVPVGISTDNIFIRAFLASAAYGFGGSVENDNRDILPETDQAIRILRNLYKKGLLDFYPGDTEYCRYIDSPESAPVTICFDYQAADAIKHGHNIIPAVPAEGTLSFEMGLLSDFPLKFNGIENILLENGLMLAGGKCDSSLYPADEEYTRAVPVKDFNRFTEITENTTADIRRDVMHQRFYSPANGFENIMVTVIAVILMTVWMASAIHRSPRKDIQRSISAICIMCTCWLMLMLFKYRLPLSLLNRICWYCYYIFISGLPLVLLYTAVTADRPDTEKFSLKALPAWFMPFAAVYPAIIFLVFTNDFHNAVFRFDPNGNWSTDYTYGPGYFIIFAYCIVTFLFAVILMIKNSWKSPGRFSVLLPLSAAFLMIAYNAGYVMGIPLARESNLSLIFCLLSILMVESVLHSGLIPANTHYRNLFSDSGLGMQLIDRKGNTVLKSSGARRPESEDILKILMSPGITLELDENTLMHSHSIRGGTALWQEDITPVNELRSSITRSVKQIENANILLCRESDVKKKKFTAEAKSHLLEMLENDIENKTEALSDAVRHLSLCSGQNMRQKQISYITLMLCHIKRRCNLFFIAMESRTMSCDELAVYLDELSEFAGYSDIKALVRCSVPDSIGIADATLCYDFYFELLSWSIQKSRATLIGRLELNGSRNTFSIMSSENTGTLEFTGKFMEAADSAGASLEMRNQDDMSSIILILSGKER